MEGPWAILYVYSRMIHDSGIGRTPCPEVFFSAGPKSSPWVLPGHAANEWAAGLGGLESRSCFYAR